MSSFGVVLLPTAAAAMRAEKLLRKASVRCTLIPTPRELSKNCGLALRYDWAQTERVRALLLEAGLESAEVHPT
jgi:hypothetical protein